MTRPSRPSLVGPEDCGRSLSLQHKIPMISFVVGSRSFAFPYAALNECRWQGPTVLTVQECLTLRFGIAEVKLFGRMLSELERLIVNAEISTVTELRAEQRLNAQGQRVDRVEVVFRTSEPKLWAWSPGRLSGERVF